MTIEAAQRERCQGNRSRDLITQFDTYFLARRARWTPHRACARLSGAGGKQPAGGARLCAAVRSGPSGAPRWLLVEMGADRLPVNAPSENPACHETPLPRLPPHLWYAAAIFTINVLHDSLSAARVLLTTRSFTLYRT